MLHLKRLEDDKDTEVRASSNNATLEGLEAGTEYRVFTEAYNRKGGKAEIPSLATDFVTSPRKVDDLVVGEVTDDLISLQWSGVKGFIFLEDYKLKFFFWVLLNFHVCICFR